MMGYTYEDILERIQQDKSMPREDIEQRIKQKLDKLSGLISKEGAAHIVANELGVDLISSMKKTGIKISSLMPGMRNITVVGRIVRDYGIKSYTKENRQGRVGSFLVGDATGLIRIVVWDESILNTIQTHQLPEGTIIRVSEGLIKDNNGYKEMHLGNRSSFEINPSGVTAAALQNIQPEYKEKKISELQEGEYAKIFGTVVQVFDLHFYQGCSECGKKMDGSCSEHPSATSIPHPVLNFHFDDGSGNLRAVAFREQARQLIELAMGPISDLSAPDLGEELKKKFLGQQIVLEGRAQQNTMMGNIEFVVRKVDHIDPAAMLHDDQNDS